MSDELLSLRALIVARDPSLRDLFRQAASALPVPLEIVDCVDNAAVQRGITGADLAYLDGLLPSEERAGLVAALRGAVKPPFSILMATGAAAIAYATDAVAGRPSRVEESRWLLERTMRVRLPSRVLVVDDSATMRAIVAKALAATRFPFDVTEVDEGKAALERARESEFDLVFLDHNMPGLSGLDTLSEFKREKRRVSVVMMTSAPDATLAKRARDAGAAFLKKPFFPADIEKVLCGFYGLRALHPNRA